MSVNLKDERNGGQYSRIREHHLPKAEFGTCLHFSLSGYLKSVNPTRVWDRCLNNECRLEPVFGLFCAGHPFVAVGVYVNL